MPRRRLTPEEQQAQHDYYLSQRTCHDTPAIRHFLERADVTEVTFPSGGVWVFIAPTTGFYGVTRLEAVEAAMQAVENFPRERP